MATGKVGQGYDATVTSSVPADPVPAGTVVATSDTPSVATVGTANASNVVHVSFVGPGTATITYSAPGFTAVSEADTVTVQPALVVTDGPVA